MSSEARVGVDVGGTFTDVILHGADGRVRDPQAALDAAELRPRRRRGGRRSRGDGRGRRGRPRHDGRDERRARAARQRGRRSSRPAGFRDVLELRRLRIPHMYDLFWRKPPPLVERRLRFELNERVAADGTVRQRRSTTTRRARSPARLREPGSSRSRSASSTPTSIPSTSSASARSCAEELPGGERLALERDPARAARVRALRDHRSSTPTCGR